VARRRPRAKRVRKKAMVRRRFKSTRFPSLKSSKSLTCFMRITMRLGVTEMKLRITNRSMIFRWQRRRLCPLLRRVIRSR
jgi:hypothetical protein